MQPLVEYKIQQTIHIFSQGNSLYCHYWYNASAGFHILYRANQHFDFIYQMPLQSIEKRYKQLRLYVHLDLSCKIQAWTHLFQPSHLAYWSLHVLFCFTG